MCKIAITVSEDRIAPVFDEARHIVVYNSKLDKILELDMDYSNKEISQATLERGAQISEAGVDIIICGAISRTATWAMEAYGFVIYSFISGTIVEVLDAWRNHQIDDERLKMPGHGRCRAQANEHQSPLSKRCCRKNE